MNQKETHTASIPKIDVPAVWAANHGNHVLSFETVESASRILGYSNNFRLTYAELTELASVVVDHSSDCSAFSQMLDSSAEKVYGERRETYVTPIAYAIVRTFYDAWCEDGKCP